MPKKLHDQPAAGDAISPYITLEEDAAGQLYLTDGERVYSGLEHLDPGSGLDLILAAAMGPTDDWDVPSLPFSEYEDRDTGAHQSPGELVACYDAPGGNRQDASITVYPFACGKAARRLLGLPALD